MRATGYMGGWVEFDGEFVSIGHGGATRLLAGSGVKRMHVGQIGAVNLKPAGILTNGYVQFAVSGSPDLRSRAGRQTFDAAADANSVVFRRGQQSAFEALVKEVEAAIARLRQAPQQPATQGPAPDVADQLTRLWQLVQAGAVTQQEFEAEKARLLGPSSRWPTTPGSGPAGPPPRRGW